MEEKQNRIKNALLEVSDQVYHYHAMDAEPPYLVWAEEQTEHEWSDNTPSMETLIGTVDYFTLEENDPAVRKVEQALTGCGASWSLESVQFEENTGLIHYEWAWEVV